MKIDIPFFSSIWALVSSDTHWTSSEQSIIHNEASLVNCGGMCALQPLIWSEPLVRERLRDTVKSAGIRHTISGTKFHNSALHYQNSTSGSAFSLLFCVVRFILLQTIWSYSLHRAWTRRQVSKNVCFYFERRFTTLPVVYWLISVLTLAAAWWVKPCAPLLEQAENQIKMGFILL